MNKSRKAYIETMRGLACVLLVLFHTVGQDSTDGLHLPPEHPLHFLNWIFLPLRMPLFAFISGFVFAASVASLSDVGGKFASKARRLLVPLVTVGTIYYLARAVAYDLPLINVWRVYFGSYEHWWYLQASITLMTACLFATLAFSRDGGAAAALLCLGAGGALYLCNFHLDPNWFSITKALYIAPFFFLGQLFQRAGMENKIVANPSMRWGLVAGLGVAVVALTAVRIFHLSPDTDDFATQGAGMLALSLAICTLMFALRWENSWLAWIGPYSYGIFLFHIFFTAGSRLLLERLGLYDTYALLACGLALGIGGPIAVQLTLGRNRWFTAAFLGTPVTHRKKPGAPAAVPDAAADSEPAATRA